MFKRKLSTLPETEPVEPVMSILVRAMGEVLLSGFGSERLLPSFGSTRWDSSGMGHVDGDVVSFSTSGSTVGKVKP